jgi:hypothetical protein
MVLTGTVEQVDGDTATVKVVGANGVGRHVTGTVTVTVPGGGAGSAATGGGGSLPSRDGAVGVPSEGGA